MNKSKINHRNNGKNTRSKNNSTVSSVVKSLEIPSAIRSTVTAKQSRQIKSHKFQRTYDASNVVSQVGADTLGAFSFVLSSLPGVSNFTNLYDQYRVAKLTFHFINQQTTQATGAAGSTTPILFVAADYDDDTAWGSLSTALQYENLAYVPFYKELVYSVKPRVALAAYSGVFTSFANADSQWIDAASTGVKHYGIKYGISSGTAGTISGWRVLVTVDLEAREVF